MPEVRTTNLRFNLGKESQRKAWQYLQTMDKSAFKSYSQAVATAVLDWREAWADAVNRTLEEKQQSVRVTHLSHAALGLDEQPTVHEGSQARNLELQGIKADRCELNRQIRADNKLLRELKAQLAKLSKVVENTVEHIAETLERLRSSLIMLQYRLLVNRKRADTWKRQVNYYRPILQDYHAVTQQLADKKSEQENLQVNRNVLSPLQINQRRQLAEQIAALTEEIEELENAIADLEDILKRPARINKIIMKELADDGMTMAFLTMSMCEIFHSFNMRSQRKSVFALPSHNKVLWGAMIGSLVLTTVVLEVPVVANAFGFTPVSWAEYGVAMGLAILVIPIVELVKCIQRRAAKKRSK